MGDAFRPGKARQGRAGSVLKLRPGTSPPSRMGAGLLISPGTGIRHTHTHTHINPYYVRTCEHRLSLLFRGYWMTHSSAPVNNDAAAAAAAAEEEKRRVLWCVVMCVYVEFVPH